MVNHAGEYVVGQVHTQGIENFWSLLKRTLREPTLLLNHSILIATLTNRCSVSTIVLRGQPAE